MPQAHEQPYHRHQGTQTSTSPTPSWQHAHHLPFAASSRTGETIMNRTVSCRTEVSSILRGTLANTRNPLTRNAGTPRRSARRPTSQLQHERQQADKDNAWGRDLATVAAGFPPPERSRPHKREVPPHLLRCDHATAFRTCPGGMSRLPFPLAAPATNALRFKTAPSEDTRSR